MMKSIGSQIGLPFLSQDEDARLQFRSGKNGIKRLAMREVNVIPRRRKVGASRERRRFSLLVGLWYLLVGQAIPVHDAGYWSQVGRQQVHTPSFLQPAHHLSVLLGTIVLDALRKLGRRAFPDFYRRQ
jgi:hypothetical protein